MSDWFVIRNGRRRCALPARIRLKLWATRKIDTVAIWLVDHDHTDAATYLWRATGMWKKR